MLIISALRAQGSALLELEDGMPPLYRKATLAGFPFPDPMPQDAVRSDMEREHTYVDAMTLRLLCRTTDIYVPIQQGDLALAVNRNVEPSAWIPEKGLLPAQHPDLPFGNCWSSGLAANVHITERSAAEPIRVSVTDEQGTIHPFIAAPAAPAKRRYTPLPTARSDQDWTQMHLELDKSGAFVLRRKFGTVLVFSKEPSTVLTISNSGFQERHSFFRLVSVSDRYGSKIDYVFDRSNHGVIPNEIVYRDQRIRVELNKAGMVERLVDPAGGDRLYEYRAPTQPGGVPLMVTQRQQLTGEFRAMTHYDYEEFTEGSAGSPAAYHCNVSRISDPRGNTHTFDYTPDISRLGPGSLRCVSAVTLPDSLGATHFFNYSHLAEEGVGPRRMTFVSDALGNGCLYEFSDNQIVPLSSADGKTAFTKIAICGGQTISRFSGSEHEFSEKTGEVIPKAKTTLLAHESYSFDSDAGWALKKATDASGNAREFTYGDPLTTDGRSSITAAPWATHHGDPTAFTDPSGALTHYTYEPAFRLLTQTTDADGRIFRDVVEGPCARLVSKLVYADAVHWKSDIPFNRTDFEYARKDFPGFVTRKTIRKTTASPEKLGWEHDLVSSFEPDDLGRIVSEISDPEGLKQTKLYAYDENGNKRSVTFSNGYRIEFKYDAVNHLTRVFRPTGDDDGGRSVKTIDYNPNGDKTKETDPDGTMRSFDYDALNRRIRQIDYPPGCYPDKPERTVEQQFNAAGSETRGIDSKGEIVRREYDAIQRVSKVIYHDNSSATFGYGKNCGDGLFDSSVWKSTIRSVVGAPTTEFHYDAAGRQREVVSSSAGFSAPSKRTEFQYDAVGNLRLKIDSQGGKTTYDYDPLNRLIKTTFPDGKSEQTLFTSTGLKYATIDVSGKRAEQAFDSTGKPIKDEK